MNWLKPASLLLLPIMATACSNLPFFWRQPPSSPIHEPPAEEFESALPQTPAHVRLEMNSIHYDGQTLSGRILISPVNGRLRLDKRLISNVSVRVRAVSDCTTGQPIEAVMTDRISPPARNTDLLILEQGYWYGGTVRLPLFIEHITGNGPECVNADFSLFSFDGDFVATVQVHAVQQALPSTDGGLMESQQTPAERGAE